MHCYSSKLLLNNCIDSCSVECYVLDCGHWGSKPFQPGLKRQVEVNKDNVNVKSRFRLRLYMFSSDLGFVLDYKCPVVTLKVLRAEWRVVIFVGRYYDYIICTGRRPSWLVKVFRRHLVLGLVLCWPASFCSSVGLLYI
jgi:hypothetical protein